MQAYDEHSAGFIIYIQEKGTTLFLLLKYGQGHWDFVKGHLENNETPLEAAIRECAEETGIKDIKHHKGFQQTLDWWFTRNGKRIHKKADFFLAETKTKTVTLTEEHEDFAWLPCEKAIERVTYKSAKDLLHTAQRHLQQHPHP